MKNDLQIVKESAQPARFKRWVPPVAGLLLVGVIGATYCGLHARAAVAAPKADSAEAKKLPTQELASSDFATVEFASAINKLVRMELLPASTAQGVFADFDAWRRRAVTQVSLESRDLAAADAYLRRLDLNLRTGDAIHIAIAARVDASLATFDQRMAQVASLLGLDIAPA